MELERELLEVLDNPTRVWRSIMNNLAIEAQICLYTFATCETPLDIVEWQAAVARVNLEAAVKFEASLRVLDDTFITTHKGGDGLHYAIFRNPSMDDFCASHLDANSGFATSVATYNPSLEQVRRLIDLASARDPEDRSRPRHANLHAVLVTNPEILVGRLLELVPISFERPEFFSPVHTFIKFLSLSDISKQPRLPEIRARLAPALLRMSFHTNAVDLYELLDNRRLAITTSTLLGQAFEGFYKQLVESATELGHFDTLVNLDEALDRSPEQASWAERFEEETWLDEDNDASTLRVDLEYFTKIAEYLDLDVYDAVREWETAVEEAETKEQEEDEDDDDRWRDSRFNEDGDSGSFSRSSLAEELQRERTTLDALFESLTHER